MGVKVVNYKNIYVLSIGTICLCCLIFWSLYGNNDVSTNEYRINFERENEHQCNINLKENRPRFGSFFGVPLYYIKKGSSSNETQSDAIFSIATILTIDHLVSAKVIATNFNGPISISIFIESFVNDNYDISHKGVCNEISKTFDNVNNKYDISISILYTDHIQTNVALFTKFPINPLRNLAVSQIKTKYVLCLDVDFTYMSNTINQINSNTNEYRNLFLSSYNEKSTKTVYVIPSFELNSDYKQYILTKSELLKLIDNKYVDIFYKKRFDHAQVCTMYDKWYNATNNYKIEYCHFQYEPYIIMPTEYAQNEYKWDDNYVGRGCNRAQHIALLAYDCFQFQVLNDMFIMHEYSKNIYFKPKDYGKAVNTARYHTLVHQVYCNNTNINECWTYHVCNRFFDKHWKDFNPLQFEQMSGPDEAVYYVKNSLNKRYKRYIHQFDSNKVTIHILKTFNYHMLRHTLKIFSHHERLQLLAYINTTEPM